MGVFLALLFCYAPLVAGQTNSFVVRGGVREVNVGDRVRFVLPGSGRKITAELTKITPDSIAYRRYCERCQTITVSQLDVARLQVSEGESSGQAFAGVIVGALLGTVPWPLLFPYSGIAGGLIGGFIGSSLTSEQWEPAVLER